MFSERDQMRVPDGMPVVFSGSHDFVRDRGVEVWSELCDRMPIGQWFTIQDVAEQFDTLKGYKSPGKYLRAVIKAALLDQIERPEKYERPVIEGNSGMRLTRARLI